MTDTASFSSLSVIIPTYNRKDLLAKALQGYLVQSSPQLIKELLVIDDGSTDGTESMVREFSPRAPFPIRYFRQPNQGPAAARNVGIREACSNLVLFSDSDIIPTSGLARQHLEWHKQNPQVTTAILGYVTWDPRVNPTPFMRWYGEGGPLFAFRQFRNEREISFRFFYSCNLSLKTEFLRSGGQFDEDFKSAAYEDIELGYRLRKKGLQLLYNPAALAHHYQFFSFADACRKAEASAAARRIFEQKEAGRYLQEQRSKKAAGLSRRVATWLAAGVSRAVGSNTRWLDSRIPLPSLLYRSIYWHRVYGLIDRDSL